MYLEGFAHLWYWRKRCFSETPNRLLSFLARDVIPWCTWETKTGSLCQTGDSCSARKEDNARLPEQRAHGCPPTNISAALESQPKTAHAKSAEASLFFSPAHLQPPSGAGWSPVCSWQQPQQGKLSYQPRQASQAALPQSLSLHEN